MAIYQILTRDGVVDPGQEELLAQLASDLKKPNAKLLLHLHGGLNDEASAKVTATRLSGSGPNSWGLDSEWTQVYVIWRTGVLETLQTNWLELVNKDQFYQTVMRKLIAFLARKLGGSVAVGRGGAAVAISEAEIQRRLLGQAGAWPFDDLDSILPSNDQAGARSVTLGAQTDSSLAAEFKSELAADNSFKNIAADIDEAVNVPSGARAASAGANGEAGREILNRFDEAIQLELAPPPVIPGQQRGLVSVAAFLLKHAAKVALRCFKRFESGRDHGFHATVVEEVCREFYGDLIGAGIWGLMVQDTADHFGEGKFGSLLIDCLAERGVSRFAITAHSAGSIWASHLLINMKAKEINGKVGLFLLAPAVRRDFFSTMLNNAGDLISHCRMITMTDAFERKDPVLGSNMSYIYPSSLLYLVSGLFEKVSGAAYVDAPLLGMQRFVGLEGLTKDEKAIESQIAEFFQKPDCRILTSPTEGVSMANSHGGFDDEAYTLATARALF
ncbi:hypothetical protein [Pseudomonas aeruginosa]|uniref:hypothetical protein n=2 Tax=Pseudomonas aeruginosa TaxID=287 RepID=UPI000AEC08BE|nr:hypothetical protein [Pseudomonas aeruginosa]MBG4186897.1 hypothetical protein [Pseudomonas aeruginosa]MBW6338280.1 hypothetical protein [Pseudomonas aeruginosa]MEA8531992.1 hypothetical protein [Pseudomonas aeruginosa]MEA8544188.1 hypothetical protein [Pseudomonas aeruginosa]MEA8554957.1 hypothetical protein [Pseudomonas aeruginosa]